MTFILGIPTRDEFQGFVPMMFEAMAGTSAYVNACCPHSTTEYGQKKAAETFLSLLDMDPSVKWLKVTDSDTGKIISVCQWNIYTDAKPPEIVIDGSPGTWDNDLEKEFAQTIFRAYMQDRWIFLRETELPIMCLSMMTTDPKFQHRGAGTLMMNEMCSLADRIGATCIVEGLDAGRWLYEQSGFVVRKHVALEMPDKFADRQKQRHFFMARDRASRGEHSKAVDDVAEDV